MLFVQVRISFTVSWYIQALLDLGCDAQPGTHSRLCDKNLKKSLIAAKEAFETGVETGELAASVAPEQVSGWVICFLAHVRDCRALLLLYCCTGAGV